MPDGFGTYSKDGETREATSPTDAVNLEARGWALKTPRASKATKTSGDSKSTDSSD